MSRPSRPSPATVSAWQGRRFGMFIHWGLYAIPAGVWKGEQIDGYNEQIQAHARIPKDEYAALAAEFNPVLWDPDAVAALAKEAGMNFIVLTSKHHDGFSLFHTRQSSYNVVDSTPYGQDIVAGLAEACKRAGLSFGVYFSTIDWHLDAATPIDYEPVSGVRNDNVIPEAHAQFNAAQLTELLTQYGPISEVWFDMGKPTPEQSRLFADTVHQNQSETMVSGRVFNYEGDFTVMGDNEIPPYPIEEPWQSPASIFHETWGYRSWQPRNDLPGKIEEHIGNLVRVASRGGNYLLNIGPRGDGSIVEFEADVLRGIGRWLEAHRIAIEDVEPQPFRSLDFGSATVRGNRLYLFILSWPHNGELRLPGLQTEILSARYLGGGKLEAVGTTVVVGTMPPPGPVPVVEVELADLPVVRTAGIEPIDGEFVLLPEQADPFSFKNGFGYSDPPKLYKLRWWIEAETSGTYRVIAECEDCLEDAELELQVGDQILVAKAAPVIDLGTVLLPVGEAVEVALTPRRPFAKGTPLPVRLTRLKMIPEA